MEKSPRERETLFLLEFIVDKVSLGFCTQFGLKCVEGQTCITFKFLNKGPFSICEEDFQPKQIGFIDGCTGNGNIKNGKSCLFSLTQHEIDNATNTFYIYVDIHKVKNKMHEKDNVLIGKCIIPVMQLFQELTKSMEEEPPLPIRVKTYKDCFKISNNLEDQIGHLSAYIRMSCLGRMVINEFEMHTSNHTINYKPQGGNYNYKFSKDYKCIDGPKMPNRCPPLLPSPHSSGGCGPPPPCSCCAAMNAHPVPGPSTPVTNSHLPKIICPECLGNLPCYPICSECLGNIAPRTDIYQCMPGKCPGEKCNQPIECPAAAQTVERQNSGKDKRGANGGGKGKRKSSSKRKGSAAKGKKGKGKKK